MGSTSIKNLPYPEQADPVNVAGDLRALAEAVDAIPDPAPPVKVVGFSITVNTSGKSKGTQTVNIAQHGFTSLPEVSITPRQNPLSGQEIHVHLAKDPGNEQAINIGWYEHNNQTLSANMSASVILVGS